MTSFQLIDLFTEISDYYTSQKRNIEMTGVLHVERSMKERIFFEGKNVFNSQIGEYGGYWSEKYQSHWIPLRYSRGLQIDYVDLKFTGELMDSIIPQERRYGTDLRFADTENFKKASFQEGLQAAKVGSSQPMDIFAVSEKESGQMAQFVEKQLLDIFDEILNDYQ